MKRILVVLALVALMSNVALAEGMMFGVKGGLNLANVTGDLTDEFDPANKMKMAFGGGVWMSYAFTEAISIQPELMYMIKGFDWDTDEDVDGWKGSYLDLNVLGKFAIPMEGDFGIAIYAGPFLGFLMSSELMGDDIKDDNATMNFGALGGAEFAYMLEQGCITLDVRYSMGFTTVFDVEDLPEGEDQPDLKTTGIQFLVGYGFAF